MSGTTSLAVTTADKKYDTLKPLYDSALQSSISSLITCDEMELVTYTYEKIPSSNQYLAEEGIGEYVEKVFKSYKYDIYDVNGYLISL